MTTLAQPPTTSKISLVLAHQVADALKMAQLGNDSLMRALDRALALMEQGHYMELRGNVLRIASASQEGVTYATMINECPYAHRTRRRARAPTRGRDRGGAGGGVSALPVTLLT